MKSYSIPRRESIRDIKLEYDGRAEALDDFQLPLEIQLLFARIDEMRDGCIQRVEVRAGVPRRIIVETPFPVS